MNRALERWVGHELAVLREDLAARVRTPHPSDIRHGRARRGVMAVTTVSVGVMAALSVATASSAVFAPVPAAPAVPAPQPASAGAVPSGPPALGATPNREPARPPARPAPARPAPPVRPGEGRADPAPRVVPSRPAPPVRPPAAPAVRPVADVHHSTDDEAVRIGLDTLEPRGIA